MKAGSGLVSKKISMLFSTPGGGRFSRAPPFVKTLGLHVHRSVLGGPSFVKLNTGAFLAHESLL